MENKINIAELLKDCPKGMELDCSMWNDVTFEMVQTGNYPIKIRIKGVENTIADLTEFGEWTYSNKSKCVIFPKGKTTWEGFVPPCKFKDGDILINERGSIFIYKGPMYYNKQLADFYCGYRIADGAFLPKLSKYKHFGDIPECRLATGEEKQKIFDVIKENGYCWNSETKTLEKLTEPKFKVGDRIKHIVGREEIATVVGIEKLHYILDSKVGTSSFSISLQREWELVPNKFDISTLIPFESRVLVRECETDVWQPAFYVFFNQHNKRFYTTSTTWLKCIPYNEDTKHLTGTTNDCDEFYKNWE